LVVSQEKQLLRQVPLEVTEVVTELKTGGAADTIIEEAKIKKTPISKLMLI
jgi:hypothetical protein